MAKEQKTAVVQRRFFLRWRKARDTFLVIMYVYIIFSYHFRSVCVSGSLANSRSLPQISTCLGDPDSNLPLILLSRFCECACRLLGTRFRGKVGVHVQKLEVPGMVLEGSSQDGRKC